MRPKEEPMFSHLLVPLDQSPVATRAIPLALTLAQALDARVTLLSVVEPVAVPYESNGLLGTRAAAIHQAEEQALARATQHLDSVADTFTAHSVGVETTVCCGNPGAEIIAAAREHDGTLIVMSTHGHTGIGRPWYRGVTRHVIRHADVPTLIVPGGEERGAVKPTVQQIIVTLDGSSLAREALPVALNLAETLGETLMLVRVIPNMTLTQGYYYDPTFLQDQEAEDEHAAIVELAEVAASLQPATCAIATAIVYAGTSTVEERIGHFVEAQPGSLLVMASHGRGGVLRWALGSIAEGVLSRATFPVLVVRAGTPQAIAMPTGSRAAQT